MNGRLGEVNKSILIVTSAMSGCPFRLLVLIFKGIALRRLINSGISAVKFKDV